MSFWTYIFGSIKVHVPGRTQAEIQYILDTVLEHLPVVTGSEGEMKVHAVRNDGYNKFCSADEFGMQTNNLRSYYGDRTRHNGNMETQDEYTLVINASLRDRMFEQTKREFIKWLIRLSKRLWVENVLVNISGYDGSMLINESGDKFYDICENPSWTSSDGKPSWWEYLMWERHPDSYIPLSHMYKYYNDEETNKEIKRRLEWVNKYD